MKREHRQPTPRELARRLHNTGRRPHAPEGATRARAGVSA